MRTGLKAFLFMMPITAVFIFASPLAASVEIKPHVIDEKAKASEIIERTIRVKNNFEYNVSVYPIVNDLSEADGRQEFIDPNLLDKSTSLARWIKIQRAAIQLGPGEEVEIPLKIEVNLNAIPGKRFAVISFPHGPDQYKAVERAGREAVAQMTISVEIEDEKVEKAQLLKFTSAKNTYFKWPAEFMISLKNIGNVDLSPSGSIYIYDRRERLLEVIALDQDFGSVGSETVKDILVAWDKGSGMGKFKAKLELEYGAKEKRDLADTAYFWVLPLSFLLIFIGGLTIAVFILVYYLFKKTYIHRQAYLEESPKKEGEEVINLKKTA